MRKKLIAAALMGVMVLSLAACRKIDDNKNAVELTDYSEYVTLGDYSGLDIEVASADVTDAQVQDAIDSTIEAGTEPEHITDRVVADKDTINLDYTGKLDGEAFDNGSATGTEYTIGGGFIPSLNDQLIGLECGKEYDLNVKFPDEYTNNPDLAGKDTVFTVKVNYICGEDIVPEWTDDFINTYTEGKYTTTADYEAYIREQLKQNNENTQLNNYHAALWAAIIDNADIKSYPEDKVNESYEQYYSYYKSQYESMAQYYGMEYDALLEMYNLTDEDLQTQCRESAEQELEYVMFACLIAEKEGITVNEDEYQSMAESAATAYTYTDTDTFIEQYGEDYVMESFIFQKVSDWLYEQNKMVVSDATEADTTAADETETTTAAE